MTLHEIIPWVFLDIAVVIVAARLMGALFRRLRQPGVVGEIIAGIALGPSLLGLLPGDLDTVLFPLEVRPYLSVIAQLGLVLFMFVVGLEVDMSLVQKQRRTATTVSLTSIALPFGLGLLLATYLHGDHGVVGGQAVSPLAFGLFLGVAMSITAFPVLARILTERNMHRVPTGVLALACAAIDDVVAWSLLALVIAVAVGGTFGGVATILGLTAVYAAVMFLVVRPLLRRLVTGYRRHGRLTPDALAAVLVGVLVSALATEVIGVHAIFGAFVFGAVMPRDEPALTRAVLARIEQVSVLLLLPMFFVVAGLQVDIRRIDAAGLGELVLILAVAIGGKFFGAAIAARLCRVPQRQAVALGVLMNTRGLTEIVILQVGAQLGVLDQELFTLMVLMALITTIMTEPLLRRVYPDRVVARDIAAAERAELGEPGAYTVVVGFPADRPAADAAVLLDVARGLTGGTRPARLVLARFLPRHAAPLELVSGVASDLTAVAAAGGELRALAGRAEIDGTAPSVVARFSADPAGDLAELARSVDAEAVVVAEPADGEALPRDLGEIALVTVRLPARVGPQPTLGVLVGRGAAGRAAVRLAGLLAVHHGGALAVGGPDERRARAALGRRGVETSALGTAAEVDVLVAAHDADPADVPATTALLRVHPALSDVDEGLDEVVARIPGGGVPTVRA